jgi:hypothetical protein
MLKFELERTDKYSNKSICYNRKIPDFPISNRIKHLKVQLYFQKVSNL